MTPSSCTRAPELAADGAQPEPAGTAKTTKVRNTRALLAVRSTSVPAAHAVRPQPRSRSRRRTFHADPARPALSSRELEILRLLADGASNPDISRALYISRRTAEHHVEHILTKLAVTSRTAAVAYALTHELLS